MLAQNKWPQRAEAIKSIEYAIQPLKVAVSFLLRKFKTILFLMPVIFFFFEIMAGEHIIGSLEKH